MCRERGKPSGRFRLPRHAVAEALCRYVVAGNALTLLVEYRPVPHFVWNGASLPSKWRPLRSEWDSGRNEMMPMAVPGNKFGLFGYRDCHALRAATPTRATLMLRAVPSES